MCRHSQNTEQQHCATHQQAGLKHSAVIQKVWLVYGCRLMRPMWLVYGCWPMWPMWLIYGCWFIWPTLIVYGCWPMWPMWLIYGCWPTWPMWLVYGCWPMWPMWPVYGCGPMTTKQTFSTRTTHPPTHARAAIALFTRNNPLTHLKQSAMSAYKYWPLTPLTHTRQYTHKHTCTLAHSRTHTPAELLVPAPSCRTEIRALPGNHVSGTGPEHGVRRTWMCMYVCAH
jgi:hypothetical protein